MDRGWHRKDSSKVRVCSSCGIKRCMYLLEVIRTYVAAGSIVYTDCWRGYSAVSAEYAHFQVNHSMHFVDPDTGIHTNSIEGFWNGLKLQVPPRNRVKDGMGTKLMSIIWRKQNKEALWSEFLKALSDVHYDFE